MCVDGQSFIIMYHKFHKFNFVLSKIERLKVKGLGNYVLNIKCVERIKCIKYDKGGVS